MELLRFALIHIAVPAAGLYVYLWLRHRMQEEQIEEPPNLAMFIVFATYGGLLITILTSLFWYWSGMALLGSMYLLFPAPMIMTGLAVWLYPMRKLTPYHYGLFFASAGYPLLLGSFLIIGAATADTH